MSKDEHHVHLRIDKLRTMQHHCSLTGTTQTNVNILVVFIKSSRTPLHIITTAHLEVLIVSLSLPLLSAMVVNCATLAGSMLTKFPWHSEADLQHHFLWFNEILVLSLSCNFPLSTHTLAFCRRMPLGMTAGGIHFLRQEGKGRLSAVSSAHRLWGPKLCPSSFPGKTGLLLTVPPS